MKSTLLQVCLRIVVVGGWAMFPGIVCAQSGTYDWSTAASLYPGVQRAYVQVAAPRNMKINVLRIDTATPGLRFETTARATNWVQNVSETTTKTTRKFIRESQSTDHKVVAAINADAWTNYVSSNWNNETPADVLGLLVSNGSLVSPVGGTSSFLIDNLRHPSMALTQAGLSTADIRLAVSGFAFVLTGGNTIAGDAVLHPRTGLGLSQNSRYVYFMTIDGRRYSTMGATTEEVGQWLRHFGAHTGINMDGGGSTTMAWWDPAATGADKSTLLNGPVGSGARYETAAAELLYSPTERNNGSNLGVYYVTVTPGDADEDADVDLSDLGALATHYGAGSDSTWAMGDFDADGDVDLNDLGTLSTHYDAGQAQALADFASLTSVPEPAAPVVTALAAIPLTLRQRRDFSR